MPFLSPDVVPWQLSGVFTEQVLLWNEESNLYLHRLRSLQLVLMSDEKRTEKQHLRKPERPRPNPFGRHARHCHNFHRNRRCLLQALDNAQKEVSGTTTALVPGFDQFQAYSAVPACSKCSTSTILGLSENASSISCCVTSKFFRKPAKPCRTNKKSTCSSVLLPVSGHRRKTNMTAMTLPATTNGQIKGPPTSSTTHGCTYRPTARNTNQYCQSQWLLDVSKVSLHC